VTDGYDFSNDVEVIAGDDLALVDRDDLARAHFVVLPYNGSSIPLSDAISRLRDVQVLQTLTAGFDNFLPLVPHGVTLCNAAGVHDASTSEMAVVLTLSALRDIPQSLHAQDRGEWIHYVSRSLYGKLVALIGYGGVGSNTEARLLPFGCRVQPFATTARGHVRAVADLQEFLPSADVVILTVPLNDSTRGMVDAAFIAAMKPGALLVNVARGPVVDTEALLQALQRGHIQAALDVTDPEPLPEDHPLWHAPGVLIAPHLGGDTDVFENFARTRIHRQFDLWQSREPLECVIAGSATPYR
jgi:phosphoglycerate dehydrogenase-like enzyme